MRLDQAEKSACVQSFREGTKSPGVVIKEVSALRDAHWDVPTRDDNEKGEVEELVLAAQPMSRATQKANLLEI